MMSRRALRVASRKFDSASARTAEFQSHCDRSTSNTQILSRARPISMSIAEVCCATVSSRSSYGAMSFGASARSGGYVNESIPIPLVKQRNCRRRQRPAFARGQCALVCQSPQHGGACAAEGDRLAVYVERSVIVKKLRRAVESQAACGGGGRKSRLAHRRRRRKANVRLRLG